MPKGQKYHLQNKGKMVDFAGNIEANVGYLMPVQYSAGIIK